MKRSGIGSDNMGSLYSGRTYLTPTSKSSLSSYQKVLGLNYNSPKGESSKGFVFPQKPYGSTMKVASKTEKNDLILERKNSKGNNDSYSKTQTIPTPSYMAPSSSSRPTKPRGTSTKASSYEKSKAELGTSSKLYSGLKYSEVMNARDSSAKQLRTQNLEINTEIQTFKSSGGLKAYSTKNKDSKDRMQNSAIGITNTNSSLEYSKYANFGNQTVNGNLKFEYARTEPTDEKLSTTPSGKQKNVLSRILSNTSDKVYSPSTKKVTQFDSNSANSAENTLQINNFFASAKRKELENSISKKEKSLNISTKVERDREEMVKTSEMRKKVSPKTSQLEQKATQKSFASGNDYKNEDANQEQEKTPKSGQKANLNSFITKVEKGNLFNFVKVK